MIIEIKSPKKGTIGKINVSVGDKVTAGQELLSLETKKGNAVVKSQHDGAVESIEVEEGAEVKALDILLKIAGSQETAVQKTEEKVKSEEKIECDLTIIGGGPGGYVAAIKGAKLGAKVVLIEEGALGGTCLNYGCIPTKALVRSAEVFDSFKEAAEYGLSAKDFRVDMEKVIDRKNAIVSKLVGGVEDLLEKNNIRVISGRGKLINKDTVQAETEDKIIEVNSKDIIIATGSEPSCPPIPGANSKSVVTSKEILDLKELPEKFAIVGGGVIGMEIAFIFASFGVEVFVIEFLHSAV